MVSRKNNDGDANVSEAKRIKGGGGDKTKQDGEKRGGDRRRDLQTQRQQHNAAT